MERAAHWLPVSTVLAGLSNGDEWAVDIVAVAMREGGTRIYSEESIIAALRGSRALHDQSVGLKVRRQYISRSVDVLERVAQGMGRRSREEAQSVWPKIEQFSKQREIEGREAVGTNNVLDALPPFATEADTGVIGEVVRSGHGVLLLDDDGVPSELMLWFQANAEDPPAAVLGFYRVELRCKETLLAVGYIELMPEMLAWSYRFDRRTALEVLADFALPASLEGLEVVLSPGFEGPPSELHTLQYNAVGLWPIKVQLDGSQYRLPVRGILKNGLPLEAYDEVSPTSKASQVN